MSYEAPPQRVTVGIVGDDGTVFECEGLATVKYDLVQDFQDVWVGSVPRHHGYLCTKKEYVVTMTFHNFEGSFTVPPEAVL